MSEFDMLSIAAGGMDAQRRTLEIAARNLAAAQVTERGASFTRLVPQFSAPTESGEPEAAAIPEPPDPSATRAFEEQGEAEADGPQFLGTKAEPGADPDAALEMIAILGAQRAYEANASVFENAKRLAERTIDVGRL